MVEHMSGPAETGAQMDYSEHEKTYLFFLTATKVTIAFVVAVLVGMATFFFSSAGLVASLLVFLIVCIGGIIATR